MKVCVVGLRGIPNIMGGIETHCQQLYSRMDKQTQITILGRSPYLKASDYEFDTIRVKSIWAIKNKFRSPKDLNKRKKFFQKKPAHHHDKYDPNEKQMLKQQNRFL